ncbi:MAG: V-type ATPase 116kDa subunit family protein [Nitrososphaerota archaeon]
MGLAKLAKVSIIAPKADIEDVVKELFKFGDFHPIEQEHESIDKNLEEMLDRVKRIELALDTIVNDFGIKSEIGVIDSIIKGIKIERHRIEAEDVKGLVDALEFEARPIVSELKELSSKIDTITKEVQKDEALLAALQLLKDLRIAPSSLSALKRVYAVFAVVSIRDLQEIKRSLPEVATLHIALTKTLSAALFVASSKDVERVERVLKGFGVKPFAIPEWLPGTIPEAYAAVESKLAELNAELSDAKQKLNFALETSKEKILSLREGASILKDSLERLKTTSRLKRFASIEGYVPYEKSEELVKRFDGKYPVYVSEVEAIHMDEHGTTYNENPPTLLQNKGLMKAFENVTNIQGLPGHGEIDPTPFVALFFSIFYGIMFADLGQGLVLMLFGLFMRMRTKGRLRDWGMLLAMLGLSSSVAGFLLGECFGFKLSGWGIASPELVHLVEEHAGVKELNLAAVQKLLQFTIMLGIVHLTLGYSLSAYRLIKNREYLEAFASKIPTIAMYVFGVFFALAFFGAGGVTQMLTSQNPAPFIGLPSSLVGTIGMAGGIASIFVLILGRPVANLLTRKCGGFVGAAGMGLLEVLENIIHFLSNTISYARLTILLLVHIALLMLLNNVWHALGLMSLPILVIGNLGIMALEGLIVFIQSLRLHLYEFFTKFFEGGGKPFKGLRPETTYVDIRIK